MPCYSTSSIPHHLFHIIHSREWSYGWSGLLPSDSSVATMVSRSEAAIGTTPTETQGAPPNGPFSAEGALPNQMNWPEAGVSGVLWTQRRPKTPRTKLPVVVSSAAVGRFLFPRRSGWPRDAPPKKDKRNWRLVRGVSDWVHMCPSRKEAPLTHVF